LLTPINKFVDETFSPTTIDALPSLRIDTGNSSLSLSDKAKTGMGIRLKLK
jgi:hypothetical protein